MAKSIKPPKVSGKVKVVAVAAATAITLVTAAAAAAVAQEKAYANKHGFTPGA